MGTFVFELCTDHDDEYFEVTADQLRECAALPHKERPTYLAKNAKFLKKHGEEDISLVCDSYGSHGDDDEADWQQEVRELLSDPPAKSEIEARHDQLAELLKDFHGIKVEFNTEHAYPETLVISEHRDRNVEVVYIDSDDGIVILLQGHKDRRTFFWSNEAMKEVAEAVMKWL